MVLKLSEVFKKRALNISLKMICRIAQVNRSSYYAWLKRPPSKRETENQALAEKLKVLHEKSKGIYGSPRLAVQLKNQGHACSVNRVARLMRAAGIFGCARRKFRAIGTNSKHNQPISPRVFQIENKESLPQKPNQVWVSDMTYISTGEGWIYLTIVLDVFTRKIVGYAMAEHLRTEPVWEALKQGVIRQKDALNNGAPLLIHSDRGCQYASELFRNKLKILGIHQSMSRSGNCYDNAYAESFFHTLKVESIHRQTFHRRTDAKEEIQKYIEWYNCTRLHSGLGYKSPLDYERGARAA